MVVVSFAYTLPINPDGVSLVLSKEDVWAGLEQKVYYPQDFVPIIQSCKILSDDQDGKGGHVVTRSVTFKKDAGPMAGRTAHETVKHYAPSRAEFYQPSGSKIFNIVSTGPGGDHDLYMTFAFEWHHPEAEEGSDKAEEIRNNHFQLANRAVSATIARTRELAAAGKLNCKLK